MHSEHWKLPMELIVPAKGSADLLITYYPLSMAIPRATPPQQPHEGQIFIALPDGNVLLYNLTGWVILLYFSCFILIAYFLVLNRYANVPELSGLIQIAAKAKQPITSNIVLANWLNRSQEFHVNIEVFEKPSVATSFVVANIVELGPNVTKEFPVRYNRL